MLGDEPFQVNHQESESDAQVRFSAWLDRTLVEGIDAWRRTL